MSVMNLEGCMRYLMMAFVLLAGCSSRWTHPDRTDVTP